MIFEIGEIIDLFDAHRIELNEPGETIVMHNSVVIVHFTHTSSDHGEWVGRCVCLDLSFCVFLHT